MKKLITIICLFVITSAHAQITITKNDMPVAGDTIRFSNASIQTPVDLTLTGTNYLWDFSTLIPVSQGLDTFLTVSSTNIIYSLFFNSFGSNPANVAQKGKDITGVPQLTVTDVYNFYDKTNTTYEQVGIGASLNGITTPVTYGSHDVVYRFPMNYGNADSSDSNYSLTIPTLGTYAQQTHRVNHVDGWGSLITPFGTHNVLRVVTDLTGNDSVYITALSTGFSTPRPLTREYKWWGAGFEIPLLQINTSVLAGNETITAIIYRDNYVATVGLNQIDYSQTSCQLYPNPSNGEETLIYNPVSSEPLTIRLFDLTGKELNEQKFAVTVGVNRLNMEHQFASGTYILRVQQGEYSKSLRLVIMR